MIYFIRDIMDRAKSAYSGWSGWHHSWHWFGSDGMHHPDLAIKIKREATQAAIEMGDKIDNLKRRRRECLELVDICDNYIIDNGIVEVPQPTRTPQDEVPF